MGGCMSEGWPSQARQHHHDRKRSDKTPTHNGIVVASIRSTRAARPAITMPLMATRIIRLRPAVLPAFAALATAIGQGCVKFYRLSENTYLLHAIGPSYPSLDSDWLLGTADAFPAFSALVRLSFHLAGEVGLVLLTIGISFIGFLAIAALSFVILSDLHDEVQLRWLVSAVVLTAGFLPLLCATLLRTGCATSRLSRDWASNRCSSFRAFCCRATWASSYSDLPHWLSWPFAPHVYGSGSVQPGWRWRRARSMPPISPRSVLPSLPWPLPTW